MTMKRHISHFLLVALVLSTGCTAVRLQQADEAYDLMQYPKAERLYERVLAKTENRGARARLAGSYRKHNALDQAHANYTVMEKAHELSGDTALVFGEVLLAMGQQERATDLFFRVLQQTPENGRALDLYESSLGYKTFYADSGRFLVNRLTLPGIATAFGSIPYKNGIIVAGERELRDPKGNPWNERSFLDLYFCASKTIVTWIEAKPLPGSINGPYHDGPAVLGQDGRTLFFTRSNYLQRKLQKDDRNTSHLKLFRAKLDSTGKWSDLHAFTYNSEEWSTGHPALDTDGRTLYFASDRPGGYGGSDIWSCQDKGTGWGEPMNLGPAVNTAGNELFPTINGNSLYFSSSAHANMGGLDIFETHQQNGRWSDPLNMNAPINTPKDDFSFVLDSTSKAGYLSSDRDGTDQVYSFIMPDPVFYLDGVVMDDGEKFLPHTEVRLKELETGEEQLFMTGPKGKFGTPLKPNTVYAIRISHGDMLTATSTVSTKGLSKSDTLYTEIHMTPLRIGEAIAINNIYYDYDKYDIRPDAATELDKLVGIFTSNPNMSFELGSHTDSRGGDIYNLVLSDARANAAVNYLIQHGVDPNLITAKGYGEEVRVNQCKNGVKCTETEHQENRRTQFKVTGVAGVATLSSKP